MPVHYMTYVYIILMISDLAWLIIALLKGDGDRVGAFLIAMPMLFIGFSCNYHICPLFFCIGPLP